jgi:hypothetical protein
MISVGSVPCRHASDPSVSKLNKIILQEEEEREEGGYQEEEEEEGDGDGNVEGAADGQGGASVCAMPRCSRS